MQRSWGVVIVTGLVLGLASPAFSAGFALIEQSVSGLGNAFSGGAAAAEDASTVYYNPAGLSHLQGQQVVAGAHLIVPSAKFHKASASNALGASLSGGNGGNAGKAGVAPNFYYAANLNHGISLGLGVMAPFGLATEYDRTWVGRYHAVESEVKTVNINPSVAYRVNDHLSVGGGVSAQYIDVNLTSMVDFGASVFQKTLAASGGNLQAPAVQAVMPLVSNAAADIYADLNADDWGYGFNLGLLYEFSKETRFGASYRSRIKHTVTGDGKFTPQNSAFLASVPAGPGITLADAAAASFPTQGVKGSITLPASAALSVYHQLNPEWALMADLLWTEWSTFDELVIDFAGSLPDSKTTENWKDNWRYSVGATYHPSEQMVLRMGLAYDQTPVSDGHRTPRIPDESRFWTAVGAGFKVTDRLALDLAYAHLFVNDSKLEQSVTTPENAGRGSLKGEYKNRVDIASAQFSYSF